MNTTSELPRLNTNAINCLAKSYTPLAYTNQLKSILKNIYPNSSFDQLNKYQLHKIINDVLIKNYTGEQVLKYKLFNLFKTKKLIGAFEINVNNSRADFITINGDTRSYEIKSKLDNLQKLKKQTSDYVKAFEYNTVVISNMHLSNAIDIVPKSYGIWCFDNKHKFVFREAELNSNLDAEFQLNLLSKKERNKHFKIDNGEIFGILRHLDVQTINSLFKQALKERYQRKWSFIVDNCEKILPVDLQFFFKMNISPEIIYA